MHLLLLALLAAGALVAADARVQSTHPNLGGSWVQDAQPVPFKGRVPICASECTITQTGDTFEVFDGMHHNTYKANGVPVVVMAYAPTVTAKITTVSTWEKDTLVIVSTTLSADLNAGKPMVSTTRLSLTDGILTIEGTHETKDGTTDKFRVTYRAEKG